MRQFAPLALLALAACAAAPAREGRDATHPAIVSLNPCTDAILAEVADPDQILALSHYSRDPASSSMDLALAQRLPSTAGSAEEVLALRPDVVVSGNFMSPASVDAFARLGLRLEQVPIANTVEESEAQVRRLAALAGHPERGEAVVARIEASLAATRPPAGTAKVPALVWQSGGMVPGEQTLIADLLRRTGFTSFSAARGLGQADHLSLEQVLADPPRVIFAAGGATGNSDRMLSHPVLEHLRSTARLPLAPALLWCGGPTIPRALERLAEARRTL